MEIKQIHRNSVSHHETLLNLCFPHSKLNRRYLEWLYFSNPLGDVVGFDAMDGDLLVAHYACIPTRIDEKIGLLALNTATHPSYRSRGIYKAEIDWRTNSPRQQLKKRLAGDGLIELLVRPKNFPFNLKSIVPIQDLGLLDAGLSKVSRYGFTVDWIKDHKPRIQLPERLKPSPLVMIYQKLHGTDTELNSWSFPDFDAF